MRAKAVLGIVFLGACGGETTPDSDPNVPASVVHEFPAMSLEPGEERVSVCQSWTLENQEDLYVNAVYMSAGAAWHHSNWFFVPEENFAGPDGTWPCSERNFNSVQAALLGGVIFAQSTQSTSDVQAFPAGAGVRVPAGSKIVGDVHLLNPGDQALETAVKLEFQLIAASEVDVELAPLELHYFPLEIPPMRRSEFGSSCDYAAIYGAPLDFSIYYFLPHYHALGEGMRLEVVGGPNDGEIIFESQSRIGEPLGRTFDPPFDLSGASGLRFSCTYTNPREETIGWGVGDQEMCMALAFTDSGLLFAGGVESENSSAGTRDDVALYQGPCELYGLPHR